MNLSAEEITKFFDNYNKECEQEIIDDNWEIKDNKNKHIEIVIKPEVLDTSALKKDTTKLNNIYRPQTLDEYIGQDKTKKRIECYIKGCRKFNETFPHTFISAPAGHGKTLLSNITASLLNKKLAITTGGQLKSEQELVDKIVECEGGVLLIDESHRISKKIGTFMLPILEELLIDGKKIIPFTCIMATTHKGDMSQHLEALLQRFQLHIQLNHYNEKELVQILKQYHQRMYQTIDIPETVFETISKNCRYTPRIGQTLLKEYIYTQDWDVVRKNNQIVVDGLTETDIKILEYLNSNKGVGKNTIAKYIKIEPKTYEFEIEPYLIYKNLITVESRRQITIKGKEFINEKI